MELQSAFKMLLNKKNTAITQKNLYGANTRSELHRRKASSKCVRVVGGKLDIPAPVATLKGENSRE